ncbi:MAG: M15 family metallopeptidase [Candidatus Babeliales bacterium]|nr:M15 family metallopeptidase [Candidatus Babeliales bacterium]
MKKLFLLSLFSSLAIVGSCLAISQEAKDKGFVDIKDVDSSIIVSLRYATNENFIGRPVDGYKKSIALMTNETAQALKEAQAVFKKEGYCLVIYDVYRPTRSVNHFDSWSKDSKDLLKKDQYYPTLVKTDLSKLGYVSNKPMGHSRGSTVDLTIIKDGKALHKTKEEERTLLDGTKIKFLDDGTVDMGTSFDLFHEASHQDSQLIKKKYKKNRDYFKKIMEEVGFKNYYKEWWHFTLKNEPYPADKDSSYHNFAIE